MAGERFCDGDTNGVREDVVEFMDMKTILETDRKIIAIAREALFVYADEDNLGPKIARKAIKEIEKLMVVALGREDNGNSNPSEE